MFFPNNLDDIVFENAKHTVNEPKKLLTYVEVIDGLSHDKLIGGAMYQLIHILQYKSDFYLVVKNHDELITADINCFKMI